MPLRLPPRQPALMPGGTVSLSGGLHKGFGFSEGGAALAGSAAGNFGITGFGLSFTAAPSVSVPDAPTVSGLTLQLDFDFGAETAGALGTVAKKAGSLAGTVATGGGGPTITILANGRKALTGDGVDDWAALTSTDFIGFLNGANDPPMTWVAVIRSAANASQGFVSFTKGINSGASTLNRYEIWETATNFYGRKGNGSGQVDATLAGAPALNTTRIMIWSVNGNPSATATRATINGSTFQSSTPQSTTTSPAWSGTGTLLARMINVNGSTRSNFLNGSIERLMFYSGAASDANMTTIHTAIATYYT
jgi:hypothetical protein